MVGILLLFARVIAVDIEYVIYWEKGYQNFSSVMSAVTIKVKGVAYTNFSDHDFVPTVNNPEIYRRLWDVPDYVIPASENNGFFIATNILITPNQTLTTCPENVNIPGAKCDPKKNKCAAGYASLQGSGVMTGACIPSTLNSSEYACEINGWCPVELDYGPLKDNMPLLSKTKYATVLIKNHVEFIQFKIRRHNILETSNKTYLSSCKYNKTTDPLCPIFKLEDIVHDANEDYDTLSTKGAIIAIAIIWNCNFDYTVDKCLPEYKFRHLDDDDAGDISKGWNFRYSIYFDHNRRNLHKVYGIRFVVLVGGRGRKFSIIPFLLNTGSGLGLLAVETVICDCVILYFVKKRGCYRHNKYLPPDPLVKENRWAIMRYFAVMKHKLGLKGTDVIHLTEEEIKSFECPQIVKEESFTKSSPEK